MTMRRLLLLLVVGTGSAFAGRAYTVVNHTAFGSSGQAQRFEDRNGPCGVYYNDPPCIMEDILAACDAACWCNCVNTNGWGLSACEDSKRQHIEDTNTYIADTPHTIPSGPPPPVPRVNDTHYPPEEPAEAKALGTPKLVAAEAGAWAVLVVDGAERNTTVGDAAGPWRLQAVIDGTKTLAQLRAAAGDSSPGTPSETRLETGWSAAVKGSAAVAIVEAEQARWGVVMAVTVEQGAIATLRQGTGAPGRLEQTRFNLTAVTPCYYEAVATRADDWLGEGLTAAAAASNAGEATAADALAVLPPSRDYAVVGTPESYEKWVVAQNGVVKRADGAIYTPLTNASDRGPGTVVFDPSTDGGLNATQPWTDYKASRLGRHLATSHVALRSRSSLAGAVTVAGPTLSNATQLLVRVTSVEGSGCGTGVPTPPCPYRYWTASNNATAPSPRLLDSPDLFYAAIVADAASWTNLTQRGVRKLPGQEGRRLVDMSRGTILSARTLFLGLMPNYGTGIDYWSPELNRGGSLPLTSLALYRALLAQGHPETAAAYLGWYLDNDVTADGRINLGKWKPDCQFADGLSDYGRVLDMFTLVARAHESATGQPYWSDKHLPQAAAMAQYVMSLLAAAPRTGPAPGLIVGPAEHDTCLDTRQYFSINMWAWRGLVSLSRWLRETGRDASLEQKTSAAAAALLGQLRKAVQACWVGNTTKGEPRYYFLPPDAVPGSTPFGSMIESVVAEYSNFRYFSEELGSAFLSPDEVQALEAFRRSHTGTVASITRWSTHLDNMPAIGYVQAALRIDDADFYRRFLITHAVIYQSPGVFASTEQTGFYADPDGLFRAYLAPPQERDMDACVPSMLLVPAMTTYGLVLDAVDRDEIMLLRGAFRRWYNATEALNGQAATTIEAVALGSRYGNVSIVVNATNDSPVTVVVDAVVALSGLGYVSPGGEVPPAVLLRVRDPSGEGSRHITSTTAEGCTVEGVDTAAETISLALNTTGLESGKAGPRGTVQCVVKVVLE